MVRSRGGFSANGRGGGRTIRTVGGFVLHGGLSRVSRVEQEADIVEEQPEGEQSEGEQEREQDQTVIEEEQSEGEQSEGEQSEGEQSEGEQSEGEQDQSEEEQLEREEERHESEEDDDSEDADYVESEIDEDTEEVESLIDEEAEEVESDAEEAAEEVAEEAAEEVAEEAAEEAAEEVAEEISPVRFHFKHEKWLDICKLATRCDVKETVTFLTNTLDAWELDWFRWHPQFKHIFHMPRHENRRVQGMWMLLVRQANTESTKQCWFIVNGVPICYSIVEHALLSGLNCKAYPVGYNQLGSTEFVMRVFGRENRIDLTHIRSRLASMEPNGDDRLKLALLYFLTTIIKRKTKTERGYIEPFLLRIVDDLDECRTFPWGTFSFLNIMHEIDHLQGAFQGEVHTSWSFPGFILPLEALAFECVPSLGATFRADFPGADPSCPRLCKSMFRKLPHKGIALGEIYEALGTSEDIVPLIPREDELPLLEQILDDDPDNLREPIPDSWEEILTRSPHRIYFRDLYDKDIESRAGLQVEEDEDDDEPPPRPRRNARNAGNDEPPPRQRRNARNAGNAEPTETVDEKIKSLRDDMEKKCEEMEANMRATYEEELRIKRKEIEEKLQKTFEAKFRAYKEEMKKHVRSLLDHANCKSSNVQQNFEGIGHRLKKRKSTMEEGECSRTSVDLVDLDDDDLVEIEISVDDELVLGEEVKRLRGLRKRKK